MSNRDALVILDGSKGEGGGQILRSALTLALLTGRPFRLSKVRANREKPGLRPQHLAAVKAAAGLGRAEVAGAAVGSRQVTFRPAQFEARDLALDIGTAGATTLVLQTLHLPLALKAEGVVNVSLEGGTFNLKAPSFPFLATTWAAHLGAIGAPLRLTMPRAGFYPRGGGRLDAEIAPASLRPLTLDARGPLVRVRAVAGVAHLPRSIADRMLRQVEGRLAGEFDPAVELILEVVTWDAASPGTALQVTAEYAGAGQGTLAAPATFVGLGERGKPAEAVADEAIDELLAHEAGGGEVDPHSADQLLLPLAFAEGPSAYTVSAVTEHLRTNARTVAAFLDRVITVDEPDDDRPGRVTVA